jgi:hypothetical protein
MREDMIDRLFALPFIRSHVAADFILLVETPLPTLVGLQ